MLNEPSKGQPIDYSYISQMVKSINALESADSKKNATVAKSGAVGAKTESVVMMTKSTSIFTGYQTVTGSGVEGIVTIDFSFGSVNFATPPIVTVTPSSESNPQKVLLGITNVTSSSCTINVEFTEKNVPSVGINLIAIGYPAGV